MYSVNRSYKGKNIKNALRSDGRPPKAVVRYLYHLLLAYLNESHEETEIFSQMDQCLEENMKKYPASSGLFLYRVWLLAKQERIDEAKKLLAWYSSNLTRISTKRQQEEYLMTLYLQWELTKKEHDKKEAASAALELQKQTDSLVASLVWLMTERDLSDAEKLRQCERLYRIYGASLLSMRMQQKSVGKIQMKSDVQENFGFSFYHIASLFIPDGGTCKAVFNTSSCRY